MSFKVATCCMEALGKPKGDCATCGVGHLPPEPGPFCETHGNELEWKQCWNCGGQGFIDDLYDVDPNWYDQGDTETCDICNGEGGWNYCYRCCAEDKQTPDLFQKVSP